MSRRREWVDGYLFAAPFILGFLFFVAYPMAYSVWLVTHEWDLISPARYVGAENVIEVVQDETVRLVLFNTAFFTLLGVPLQLLLAFLLALALNRALPGRNLLRAGFYLPAMIPAVASAVVWLRVFHPEFGILNEALGVFGVPPQRWLFEPGLTRPAFIFMSLWSVGPQMVIFLAGLQGVPQQLLEAASIDGAGRLRRFWSIVVPMVSPVIFFNLVIGIINSFQVFASALIITNGGPENSTLFAVLHIYRNAFSYFKMGYAATLAWGLFLIIVGFTIVQFVMARRWVHYEETR